MLARPYSPGETGKKTLESRWICFKCPEHWTIFHKLKSARISAPHDQMHACTRQIDGQTDTDGQTDKHYSNSVTIHSSERIAR